MTCVRGCIITQVTLFPPLFIDNPFTKILLHGIIIFKILFHRQGKVCPLLLLVWNCENSNVKMHSKKKTKVKVRLIYNTNEDGISVRPFTQNSFLGVEFSWLSQAGTICGTFVQHKSGLKIFVLFVFTFRDKLWQKCCKFGFSRQKRRKFGFSRQKCYNLP